MRAVATGSLGLSIADRQWNGDVMLVKMHHWRRGFVWLVRLFLVLFIVLYALIWGDLLIERETYDRLFGSEYACSLSTDYCSWGNHMRSLIFPSALAVAVAVGLAWRRLREREAILYTLALVAALFVASVMLESHFMDYRR